MTLRTKKLCLRLLSVSLLGAIGAVYAYFEFGRSQPHLIEAQSSEQKQESEQVVHGGDVVLDFQSLCDIPLQRPLFDPPPPPPPVVVVTPPPPLTVTLLGTVIDPANPQAILVDDRQSVSFRTVGQAVSERHPEAIIEKIAADSVTVRRGDATTTLTIQQ